jgi:RNA polymerase sigma-70 factor (ECF subfamily)
MTQEELLVLVYRKTKELLHISMICILKVYFLINVLVSNREEAEDVLQEVLLRFGKTLILIMRVKDASTPGYLILQEIPIDKLRSKILTIKKTFR